LKLEKVEEKENVKEKKKEIKLENYRKEFAVMTSLELREDL